MVAARGARRFGMACQRAFSSTVASVGDSERAAVAKGQPRETYNIGSPEPVDLLSLAQMITQSFGPVPEIQTGLGQRGHDRTRLVPDIAKAQRDMGVSVTVPLSEAIQRTITWNRYLQSK